MKSAVFCLLLLSPALLCGQDVSSRAYSLTDQAIDKAYHADMQKWATNAEWEDVIAKYKARWKAQLDLELKRLLPELKSAGATELRQIREQWLEDLDSYVSLIRDSGVNFNALGRENQMAYATSIMEEYRMRAISYLNLYYAIIWSKDPKNSNGKPVLAK